MNKDCIVNDYRNELKERILEYSEKEFYANGVRQVKMDNIANYLSISKRTLYEIYPTKEDLLLECVKKHDKTHESRIEQYIEESNPNAIEIIIFSYKIKLEHFLQLNPLFLEELCKYKRVINYFDARDKERDTNFEWLFNRGVEEGFFRKDLNPRIISNMFTVSLKEAIDNELYKEFGMEYLFRDIVFTLIRGICTIKGIEAIDQLLN
ncbi:TetR/AcrR family transcriptional regulator [Hoylesella nanceiensis]|jgi:putative transcription regulator (tetR family)|uniref:TetR/AcrR family transcriptional regulator n=1 Tax=Hoylesella nanceiensis TaxID=425941 RepID=A0ABS6Y9T3_9BACT|nr:TetR/AcrR family transcriptional regulator [Hoylesella nanceiensis]MBW4767147.1 TetR/AcrR family transcriptional regulator [Hoylesella nanceiensis]MBW4768338.1 TetR/AcrR family transcriptional regulator [Hoylesella nanceiensis]